MIRVVRPAPMSALPLLLAAMDEADFAELAALTDLRPGDALRFALENSKDTFAAFDDEDQPLAIGGFREFNWSVPPPLVWMIAATTQLEKQKKEFLRRSRAEFASLRIAHPRMQACVDVRWTKSVRWLEWLGFSCITDAEIAGRTVHVMRLLNG